MDRRPLVGASLLAKDVNDNAHLQGTGGALEIIASKLAPTDRCYSLEIPCPLSVNLPRSC
ncbi:hypothetical protein FCI59_31740 [Pseudomonas protegens]|nr:hypothetical protein [Pseudomonas protegens]NTZ75876.1 hypothetical protein [Pseudomonas protegens]NUE76918.1 hypothetical protein [Pseudomonas protegens]RLO19709.1 hypothetical protein EAG75_30545 [Pseudomonas protegens]